MNPLTPERPDNNPTSKPYNVKQRRKDNSMAMRANGGPRAAFCDVDGPAEQARVSALARAMRHFSNDDELLGMVLGELELHGNNEQHA